jgi:uncharacterized protein (UPF0332 family)
MRINERIKLLIKYASKKLKLADKIIGEEINEAPYFIYYAFFYLMHALLLAKESEIEKLPSSHGGLVKVFGFYFPEFRSYIPFVYKCYELRHRTTYKLIEISEEEKEEVIELYNKALEFYDKVVKYLREKGFLDKNFE